MKIKPVKNYKKPNYAVKLASVIAVAGALTGCTTQTAGETTVVTENSKGESVSYVDTTAATEVQLDGDVSIEAESESDADSEVQLGGEVFVETEPESDTGSEVVFDGDIVMEQDEPVMPGWVESGEDISVDEEPELAGDVAVITDSEAENCSASGAAEE